MFSIVIARFLIRVWCWGKLIFACGMWKSVISPGTSGDVWDFCKNTDSYHLVQFVPG